MNKYVFLFQIKWLKSRNLSYFKLIFTYSNIARSGLDK